MEMMRAIDGYCERVGAQYWAEPVNAVTNFAFVLVALWMWQRSAGVPLARGLSAVLGAIGVGSYLFHTHAQVWAAIADVVPIVGFILLYVFAIHRDVWRMRTRTALAMAALFLPFAAVTTPVWRMIPVLGVSAGYVAVPVLILIHAALLWRRFPELARGFVIGAGVLFVSLLARSLDQSLCARLPLGTHFAWHLLNAAMLGWMIEVYLRHIRAHALEGLRRAR